MDDGDGESQTLLLGIDLREASIAFIEDIAKISIQAHREVSIIEQWARTSSAKASQSQLLDALSHVILNPVYTEKVALHFSPLLIAILDRSLQRVENTEDRQCDSEAFALYHCIARLVHPFPVLLSLARHYLTIATPQFDILAQDDEQLASYLLSVYRLVNTSTSLAPYRAGPYNLSKSLLHITRATVGHSIPIRLLALRIFALLEDTSDAVLQQLQDKYIGSLDIASTVSMAEARDAQLSILHNGEVVERLHAWLFPLEEHNRVQTMRRNVALHCSQQSETVLEPESLGDRVRCLGGRLFSHTAPTAIVSSTPYRVMSSVQASLTSLSEKLSDRLPILISGPEACGKSSIVKHVCSVLQSNPTSHIITFQLGDQSGVDAKSLIGTYISSTKSPGTFEWVEGALTRAVRLGKWVLLEDVDRASGEVLSVIKPLVEDMGKDKAIGSSPSLDLGSRGRVVAAETFALFATRTTPIQQRGAHVSNATFFGHEHWEEVQMQALSEEDILAIVKSTNPLLSTAEDGTVDVLVTTWSKLVATAAGRKGSDSLSHRTSNGGTLRIPSLHDLLKWCRRIELSLRRTGSSATLLARAPLSNQAIHEEIFLEACDIFLGAIPTIDTFSTSADRASNTFRHLAECLRIDVREAWHSFIERRPECKVEMNEENGRKMIRIGRTLLQRSSDVSSIIQPPSRNFAMTGPAAKLMERIAVCISSNEPTLLVGETGTGKTTLIQYLASLARKPLIALNLSQQTETSDLLGGFKPLDAKIPAMQLHNEWVDLFQSTFSSRRNARYMQAERKAMLASKWARLCETWKDSIKLASDKLSRGVIENEELECDKQRSAKARRITQNGDRQDQIPVSPASEELLERWKSFSNRVESFAIQFTSKKRNLVFSFIEGPLIKAIQSGSWVLLDEINLATAETLDCLTALLQSSESSIVLTEKGDLEPVPRHVDFRLFACMNPATDIGKKDLPNSLRSRFTELYAPSPDSDQEALIAIVDKYIGEEAVGDRGLIMDIVHCYRQIRQLTQSHQLADGANQRPHYSIRTLSRALLFAKDVCAIYGLRRAVWEGFLMAFTMLLDEKSAITVRSLLESEIMSKARNAKSAAGFIPPCPSSSSSTFVQVGAFWLETGAYPLDSAQNYILTPSVQEKLIGLARAIVTKRSPVLIQGPTSAGKTSAVEYLARRTGHKFVRINNHEHTDIQEYIGSYSSDPDSSQLVFQEGLLVTALRQGHWIVLDELNLAPSDVLEALNRLLDDNRELYISETGEIVRPHPHFMLFATQNPPGQYAGRKELSRAFRNRFLEIHFANVPQVELQTILTNRCQIAPSYAEKVVRVFRELQRRRQTGRVFDTKQAFVTLRDLFRWGNREAKDYQQLAENGYILIAERARRNEDVIVVKEVIEKVINVKIDPSRLYDIFNEEILKNRVGSDLAASFQSAIQGTSIVWTSSMQRLACLIAISLRYNEPVLLVGETGTGKTSVCQVLANTFQRQLVTVNCHQNTDSADLLGGQRPLRNRAALQEAARCNGIQVLEGAGVNVNPLSDLSTVAAALASMRPSHADEREKVRLASQQINQSQSLFEWHNGPLVEAMKQGQHMLLDEISLADDSVLERLNSVLEPNRTLVLAERSSANALQPLEIKANPSFQIIATMNPGGDYGKKELSPALRNRFTEIWVPSVQAIEDLLLIIDSTWTIPSQSVQCWAAKMIDFLHFYIDSIGGKDLTSVGLRDLIAWAQFINTTVTSTGMQVKEAFVHGAFMTFIDGVPLHPAIATRSRQQVKKVMDILSSRVYLLADMDGHSHLDCTSLQVSKSGTFFSIGQFAIELGHNSMPLSNHFSLLAPTPASNALRVVRAMHIHERSIMLEGSPGAGKTSLIVALAKESNHKLTRINLSDQTDLSDLFGADLPVEGGKAGEFDWKDAAFLRAMQEGSWVLLDEMNLASQTVLEGLNSCLDHRGSIFIPELGRSFTKHVNFRIFAAQNPQHQGGGRKGLPKSFLNRFTKVYIEELHDEDFCMITSSIYENINADLMRKMVKFNSHLQALLSESTIFSKAGQPWEFNLRDLLRWFDMMHAPLGLNLKGKDPLEYLGSLYLLRFRCHSDRIKVARLYNSIFGVEPQVDLQSWSMMTTTFVQLGHVLLPRQSIRPLQHRDITVQPARKHLNAMQALGECVRLAWPAILVGESISGKTTMIRQLAQMTNSQLEEVRLNSGTDAIDVIGGFQQEDGQVEVAEHLCSLLQIVSKIQVEVSLTDNQVDIDLVWSIKANLHRQQQDILSGISLLDKDGIIETAQKVLAFSHLSVEDREICRDAIARLSLLSHQQQSSQAEGKFAWIDGPVLRAMRKGYWLLLDDANLCSSSVLDRLNSLLEPSGNLVLSERGVMSNGQVEVVKPHKDFRIFFSLNPRYGELSRAMRNRGLEIYIDQFEERFEMFHGDAIISNLVLWTQLNRTEEDVSRHKQATKLALLGQGIPFESLPFVSFVLTDGEWQKFSQVMDTEILSDVQAIKKRMAESSKVDLTFLNQMSLDLQLNPATYNYSLVQRALFDKFQLLVKCTTFQSFLQRCIREVPGDGMSILQRSALFHQGQEVEDLTRQDQGIFSLINALLQCIPRYLCASTLDHLQDNRQHLYRLFDCLGYLTDKWSKAAFNDYSSSSVILAKAFVAASHLVKDGMMESAQAMLDSIDAMRNEIRLDTGLAMNAIWRAFLPAAIDSQAINGVITLTQQMTLAVRRDDSMRDLVSNSVDVAAALWNLGEDASAEEHRDGLLEVTRRAKDAFDAHKKGDQDESDIIIDSDGLLLSILYLATQHSDRDEADPAQMKGMMGLIKSSPTFPIETAISLQCQSRKTTLARKFLDFDLSWVKHIFKSSLPLNSSAANAEDLFRPILFNAILTLCSADRQVPLEKLTDVNQVSHRIAKIITSINPVKQSSRVESICDLLIDNLEALSAILVDSMKEKGKEADDVSIQDSIASIKSSEDAQVLLAELIESGSLSSTLMILAGNLQHCIKLSIALRSRSKASEDENCKQIGSAAMHYSITLIDSFLPNVAIDPLVTLGADEDFRRYQMNRLEQEREAILEMEAIMTGNKQSCLIEQIDFELDQLQMTRDFQQEISIRGKNTPLLHKFITEMKSFVQQIINRVKVDEMLRLSSHVSSRGRLLNLQMTICAQLDRLYSIYGSLWDLVQPLKYALSMMLLGIGLLLHSSSLCNRSTTSQRNERMLQAIVTFPTSLATLRYSQEEIPIRIKANSTAGAMVVPLLLLKVKAIVIDINTNDKNTKEMFKLRNVYDQLWHLWTLDEEHEKQQMEKETSLYKVKNLDVSVEEEAKREEEEFLALFPEYIDVMEDREVSQGNAASKNDKRSNSTFFQSSDVLQLFQLHLTVFKKRDFNRLNTFEAARVELCQRMMQASYSEMSEVLDSRHSASLQLTILHDSLDSKDNYCDFYNGADMKEAKKMISFISRTIAKLDQLINEWPDQEVLHHIRQRCQRILRLDSNSSVHQMLAAVEGLLQHTEDWEIFASSKNTLQVERNEMTRLIIEWRRLELTSWKTLLDKETTKSRDNVHTMWFSLFQVLTKTDYDGEIKIGELVSLLDQFIRGSTLGQFSTRLDLIESFALYLESIRDHFEQPSRIESTLINIHRFFSPFSSLVQDRLNSKRNVIEREISCFVKLASWKDTNVHALKVSAIKTHRKLHLCLKKYRDILNEQVDPILASLLESSKMNKEKSLVNGHHIDASGNSDSILTISDECGAPQMWHVVNETPMHLIRLSTTLQTLQSFCNGNIKSLLLDNTSSTLLIDLQSSIIDTSESLAKQTPSIWKQENEKLIKHLETRKRKAWSDLLKELRRIGFTVSSIDGLSTSQLSQNSTVFGISPLQVSPSWIKYAPKLQESDQLHYQLLSLVPVLRASINSTSRNEDIQVAQLQRGLSFVDNCFLASIVERQKLSNLQGNLVWLKRVDDRMRVLAEEQSQCLSLTVIDALPSCLDLWNRLSSALKEVESKAIDHLALFSLTQVSNDSASISNQLATRKESVDGYVALLSSLCTAIQETGCSMVTMSEIARINESGTVIDQIFDVLQEAIITTPALCSMCIPIRNWLKEAKSDFVLENVSENQIDTVSNNSDTTIGKQSDVIVSSIILVAQELRQLALVNVVEQDKDAGLADRGLVTERQRLTKIRLLLRLDETIQEIHRYFELLKEGKSKDILKATLIRVTPFIQIYHHLIEDYFKNCLQYNHSLLKLDLTLCRLMISLATRGFCRPKEEEEEQGGENGAENDEQLEGGMGLGEGEGAQDVTDTLQDDEMMEELESEEREKKDDEEGEGETKGEKNAREMDQDFDGELGDVEREEEEEEEEESQEEEAEIDDGVGKVDPLDLNAVDEKTWGGQDEDEEREGKDKSEKEQQGKESEKEGGRQAKEAPKRSEENQEGAESAGQRGQEEDRERGKEETEKEKDGEGNEIEQEDTIDDKEEGVSEMEEQTGNEEENDQGLGRAIDEEARQTDNLDLELDEDLQMDDVKSNADSDDGMDDLSDMASDQESVRGDERGDEVLSVDDDVADQQQKPAEDIEGNEEEARNDNEDKGEVEVPHEAGEDAIEDQDDESKEARPGDLEEQQSMKADAGMMDDTLVDDSNMGGDVTQENPTDQIQSSRSKAGRQANSTTDANAASMQGQEGEENLDESQNEQQPTTDQSKGARSDGQKEQGEEGNNEISEDAKDPARRSLGDALKEFQRNMDSIEERLGKEASREGQGMPEEQKTNAVEHVLEDEDAEMQAVGAAQEDEMLNGMQDVDLGVEDDTQEDDRLRLEEEIKKIEARDQLQPYQDLNQNEDEEQHEKGDGQGALMMNDVRSENYLDRDGMQQEDDSRLNLDDAKEREIEEIPLDESIETQIDALFAATDADQRHELAQDLWKSYLIAVNDYAFTLSEQLRLILTPTKATKLTGDFKTGKRLNMRKIIPFIASDYVKDKIWLRRNLPQKREYQVLLCVDDSKSMLESKNMLLAYKSLALVCSALEKLEVGQIGIMKFGKEAEILKDFNDDTLGDSQGGKILEKLQFQQRGTDVSNMLQDTFTVLSEAREKQSITSCQLWQLQIIISDGICQDHVKLSTLLQRASEEHILIVFIILDSLQQNNSILTMNSVQYTTGDNGRSQIQMTRYLDTFPFEYFVVVRDVSDLPEVLSTTLRQWAQKIAES